MQLLLNVCIRLVPLLVERGYCFEYLIQLLPWSHAGTAVHCIRIRLRHVE